jgi:hypothetical protein
MFEPMKPAPPVTRNLSIKETFPEKVAPAAPTWHRSIS